MTSLLRPVLLGVLVAALAVGCGGGEAPIATGQPISFQRLSTAATTSADASSGRFAFTMELTYPGAAEPLAFSGGGAFDAASNRAALTLDMSSLVDLFAGLFPGVESAPGAPDLDDPSLWQIEAVQDGLVVYMRFPALAEKMPAGKSWVRIDLRRAGRARGFDFSQLEQLTNNDPRKILDYVRAVSGRIETVGREELRSVDTTHYRATVDLLRYERLVPPSRRAELRTLLGEVADQTRIRRLPMDVWVDDFGLVRRLAMAFSATQPGTSDTANVSMSFELFDYGKNVEVAVPPASDVVDVSTLG